MAWHYTSRGGTIRVPHDTIRISIQRSRYNTYLDAYLNTVRCQRDVMSSMKEETPVIRSPVHNLLLQWMEYLLLQLPLLSQDVLCWVILEYFHQSDQKNVCVSISLVQEYLCIYFPVNRDTLGLPVSIRIVVTKYRCIAMHWWIVTPLYTSTKPVT